MKMRKDFDSIYALVCDKSNLHDIRFYEILIFQILLKLDGRNVLYITGSLSNR